MLFGIRFERRYHTCLFCCAPTCSEYPTRRGEAPTSTRSLATRRVPSGDHTDLWEVWGVDDFLDLTKVPLAMGTQAEKPLVTVQLAKDRMPKAEPAQFDLSPRPELTQAVVNGLKITQHLRHFRESGHVRSPR